MNRRRFCFLWLCVFVVFGDERAATAAAGNLPRVGRQVRGGCGVSEGRVAGLWCRRSVILLTARRHWRPQENSAPGKCRHFTVWLGSWVVSLLDLGAEGPGFILQPLLSGKSLRQTVYTCSASVHQAAKLVAAVLRVVGVTAGLAESNGNLPPGLWLTSPAGWLPRTGISSGSLRSVIECGLPFYLGEPVPER